jgi:indole-3-glycerol phosphate synthase
MHDFLEKLVSDAQKRIESGYYDIRDEAVHKAVSLKNAILSVENNAIIAEIKPASPSLGQLRVDLDPVDAAIRMVKAGAIGLSVLTEPDNFRGSLTNLLRIRSHVSVPLLMKDIIIDKRQVRAGVSAGADCVLLIKSAFSKTTGNTLDEIIDFAHNCSSEVMLEVHDENELEFAVGSGADIIGVNNRSLENLQTDLSTTLKLVGSGLVHNHPRKTIVSESGFAKAEDIRRVKSKAIDGFLIGSSIMLSQDLESKVREFVFA